jgi:hypothetical protein
MRYNRTRHLILEKLYLKNSNSEKIKNGEAADIFDAGLTVAEIGVLIKKNDAERDLILSELNNSKEIIYSETSGSGYFINPNSGVSALSNKKYLKKNEDIIINWFRIFAQIIVPVLSLIVAVLVLTLKLNSFTDNIESKLNKKNKLELNRLESKINHIILLENNRKNNSTSPNYKHE